MLEKNKIYLGDCFVLANSIDDECAKAIITDVPYGIANEVKITRSSNTQKFGKGSTISHDFGDWDKFGSNDEYLEFIFKWADVYTNKIKAGGMLITFMDRDKINFLSHYLQNKHKYKLKGYFAFIKKNPVPQARKVKFMSGWEIAGMWQKPPYNELTFNWQYGQQADYMALPICSGHERTKHPTQKPLKLIYPFIKYFTNPGDLIIDTFSGSGTTAVACCELQRDFIGIEKDENSYNISVERLKNTQPQLSFFS